MLLGLVFKLTICCLASRFSASVPAAICCPGRQLGTQRSAAWLIACSTLNNHRQKQAGPGPWLLSDKLSGCSATSFLLALQMEIRVPLNSLPGPYLSLLHCILSRADCSWAFCSVSCTVESGSVAKYFFGISSRLGWGRNIRAACPIVKPAPKRSAHLAVIAKPTLVTCRDLACQE